MTGIIRRVFLLLMLWATSLLPVAQAADFTAGSEYAIGNVTIWFKSQVNTSWVDAHYSLAGGGQQNVRMSWNASSSRYEYRFAATLGQSLSYWFTYNNGSAAYNSATTSTVVSQAATTGANYTAGATLANGKATLWFASRVSTTWVDAHYSLAGGAQQNVRMSWNASTARYEWSFTAQAGQTLNYWFTYNNGTPAYDSPSASLVLGSAGSSSASSVASSAASSSAASSASSSRASSSAASSASSVSSSAASSIPVGSRTMTVQLLNGTRGNFADSQIYWAIIGLNPATKAMSYIAKDGSMQPALVSDNDASGHLSKAGVNYANYFHTLAEASWVSIAPLEGARLFMSVGSPMYIRIVMGADGKVGFAGANLGNPQDPNQDVYFDFAEFTLLSTGFWGNTTRVDQFGFPLTARLVGNDGVDKTVGETETRAGLFTAFQREVPDAFKGLVKQPYRILAPGKGTMATGAAYATYFDSYVNEVWDYYRTNDLKFSFPDQGVMSSFVGRVSGDVFTFSKNGGAEYAYIRSKPSTLNVLEGSGPLASGSRLDLVVQAQICAALNRHLVKTVAGELWSDASTYYATAPTNYYAKFWHQHSLDSLAYGFAYDDVRDKSTLLYSSKPKALVVNIGW